MILAEGESPQPDADIRLDFLSPAWMAMAVAETEAALASAPGGHSLSLKVVERFSDPPAGAVVATAGEPGFVMEIAVGKVQARAYVLPGDHGMFELDCPWIDVWRSVAMRHGPALDAFNAWRVSAGRLTVRGALPAEAAFISGVHDRVADRTVEPDTSLHPDLAG